MTEQERTYKAIISVVANNLGLSYDVVDKTYKAFWLFVRKSLSELPLKEELTEDEFKKLRTSINIPSLGKFNCTYDRYKMMKKRLEYLKQFRKNA